MNTSAEGSLLLFGATRRRGWVVYVDACAYMYACVALLVWNMELRHTNCGVNVRGLRNCGTPKQGHGKWSPNGLHMRPKYSTGGLLRTLLRRTPKLVTIKELRKPFSTVPIKRFRAFWGSLWTFFKTKMASRKEVSGEYILQLKNRTKIDTFWD